MFSFAPTRGVNTDKRRANSPSSEVTHVLAAGVGADEGESVRGAQPPTTIVSNNGASAMNSRGAISSIGRSGCANTPYVACRLDKSSATPGHSLLSDEPFALIRINECVKPGLVIFVRLTPFYNAPFRAGNSSRFKQTDNFLDLVGKFTSVWRAFSMKRLGGTFQLTIAL